MAKHGPFAFFYKGILLFFCQRMIVFRVLFMPFVFKAVRVVITRKLFGYFTFLLNEFVLTKRNANYILRRSLFERAIIVLL